MNIYAEAAKEFKPEKIKVILIAESPPAPDKKGNKRYFYFPGDSRWEYMFKAIMEVIFP